MSIIALQLDRLIGVELHRREVNGEMCDCISIPIPWNGISCYKGCHYYLDLSMMRKAPNPKGQTHYLSLFYPPEMRSWQERAKNLQLRNYVGYVMGGYDQKVSTSKKPNSIELIKKALKKE